VFIRLTVAAKRRNGRSPTSCIFDPSSGQRSSGTARSFFFLFAHPVPSLPVCPSAISRAERLSPHVAASVPQPPVDTPDKTHSPPLQPAPAPPPFVSSKGRSSTQSMALSCMRCPAGAAAGVSSGRASAQPQVPAAAVSFARCGGFGRSAAVECCRIQAVAPTRGGVCCAPLFYMLAYYGLVRFKFSSRIRVVPCYRCSSILHMAPDALVTAS
jgi:hypothetical protein